MTSNEKPLATPDSAALKVKGHLSLKSSTLTTENCKLNKQFMVAQNLASHYKRIISAKSSIDCKPPNSIVKSQKARDRVKRDVNKLTKSVKSRPQSADISRKRDPIVDSQKLNTFRDTSSARTVGGSHSNKSMYEMMQSITLNNTKRVPLKTYRDGSLGKTQKMNFEENSENLNRSNVNEIANPALKAMSRLVAGRNYDVLDNHSKFFKNPDQEFVPRINKRKAESFLKANGLYNPIKARPKSATQTTNKEKDNAFEENYEPMESVRSTARTNTALTDRSNRTNSPEKSFQNLNQSIQSNNNNNQSIHEESFRKKENNMKKMNEKEEELKYLSFIKEVTDDIIARGVTTNRVINNVFEYHITRYKNSLNLVKMRKLLDTLRADIGIPSQNDTSALDTELEFSQTILKASKYDQDAHKTNRSDRVSDKPERYNILEKFDWTSETETSFRNTDQRSVSPSLPYAAKPAAKSSFSSAFKKQQSDITQNIDSIRETHRKKSLSSSPPDTPNKNLNDKLQSQSESPVESRKTSVASLIVNPKQNFNNDPVVIKSASNNNIKSDSNSSFKEDINNKRTVYLSGESDEENEKSLKFKKEVSHSVSHQNSSDLDEDGKTDRDEVDKYFMSTLKKPSIIENNDDDEETYTNSIISNKTNSNNNNNNYKMKSSIKNDDEIDFDYNFGEKEDDDDDDDDKKYNKALSLTTTNKRFQTKNFNQTLKFETSNNDINNHTNDDSSSDEKPKPAPRRTHKISENSEGTDDDSF